MSANCLRSQIECSFRIGGKQSINYGSWVFVPINTFVSSNQLTSQLLANNTHMSLFKNIDLRLIALSQVLKAELMIDRPHYPEVLRTFEERRIDWMEGYIRKAIIIQPTFEKGKVNEELWNFRNVAWFVMPNPNDKLYWQKDLVVEQPFEVIEKDIERLLEESLKNLVFISFDDLQSDLPSCD
jgi:hypothetical protein